MMNREKQIDKMSKAMCFRSDRCIHTSCVQVNCETSWFAENLYKAGYRKLEWISVEDRLPEKGEYLVAYHPCWWDDVEYGKVCVGMDTFRGKTSWAKKKFQRVTHWMPLPEPPIE